MEMPTFPEDCDSALRRHLTPAVWAQLQDARDASGFTFQQAIASGIQHPDSNIGVYAGSADSYRAFAPLFGPIIEEYHGDHKHQTYMHPESIPCLGRDAHCVRSTRMRVARNLAGMPLGTPISRDDRLDVESRIREALGTLEGDLAGTYRSLASMTSTEKRELIAQHVLFKDGDRFMDAAGLTRDWPEGRGIFLNHDRTVIVWVNEEDHLRIISMEEGGDLVCVFDRLKRIHDVLDDSLEFAYSDELGWITTCPTNLGTGLRASVHAELPDLPKAQLKAIAKEHHVELRGVHGEHSDSEGGVWDVSNARRLGYTENELVSDLVFGLHALRTAG